MLLGGNEDIEIRRKLRKQSKEKFLKTLAMLKKPIEVQRLHRQFGNGGIRRAKSIW